jgi:hypothetical protein
LLLFDLAELVVAVLADQAFSVIRVVDGLDLFGRSAEGMLFRIRCVAHFNGIFLIGASPSGRLP